MGVVTKKQLLTILQHHLHEKAEILEAGLNHRQLKGKEVTVKRDAIETGPNQNQQKRRKRSQTRKKRIKRKTRSPQRVLRKTQKILSPNPKIVTTSTTKIV